MPLNSSQQYAISKLKRTSLAVAVALPIVITALIFASGTFGQATSTPRMDQAPIILNYGELVTMPKTTIYAELYCYGSLVDRGNWTGVKLGFLLEKAGSTQQAETVELIASDGYSVTIPISVAMREDVIVAWEKDGIALPEGTRLVVPGVNGDEWISSISQIKIISPSNSYGLYLK